MCAKIFLSCFQYSYTYIRRTKYKRLFKQQNLLKKCTVDPFRILCIVSQNFWLSVLLTYVVKTINLFGQDSCHNTHFYVYKREVWTQSLFELTTIAIYIVEIGMQLCELFWSLKTWIIIEFWVRSTAKKVAILIFLITSSHLVTGRIYYFAF